MKCKTRHRKWQSKVRNKYQRKEHRNMSVLNSVENNGGLNWWGNSNEGTEYMHRKKTPGGTQAPACLALRPHALASLSTFAPFTSRYTCRSSVLRSSLAHWSAFIGDRQVTISLPMFVIVHTSTSLLVWNLGIVLAYNSNERHLIVSKFVHKSTRYKKEHVVCVSDLLQRKKQRQPEWTESLCAWRPY